MGDPCIPSFGREPDHRLVTGLLRPYLLEAQRDRAQEYRRDCAMITLRRSYLKWMGAILVVLHFAFAALYLGPETKASLATSWVQIRLIMTVGAVASVVARATRLSRVALPSTSQDPAHRFSEPFLTDIAGKISRRVV